MIHTFQRRQHPVLFQKRRGDLIIDPVRNSRILHLTDIISAGEGKNKTV